MKNYLEEEPDLVNFVVSKPIEWVRATKYSKIEKTITSNYDLSIYCIEGMLTLNFYKIYCEGQHELGEDTIVVGSEYGYDKCEMLTDYDHHIAKQVYKFDEDHSEIFDYILDTKNPDGTYDEYDEWTTTEEMVRHHSKTCPKELLDLVNGLEAYEMEHYFYGMEIKK